MTELKKFLYFTKNERSGITVLILLFVIPFLGYKWWSSKQPASVMSISEEATGLLNSLDSLNASQAQKKYQNFNDLNQDSPASKIVKAQRFVFDPNTLTEDSLLLLGLPKFGVRNLLRYRSKNGFIRKPEDFFKIYGMEKADTALRIFIKISPKESRSFPNYATNNLDSAKNDRPKTHWTNTIQTAKIQKIDLNSVDSISLTVLKGVGPYTAKKIINYRDRLGGFYSEDQLFEIKGVQTSVLMDILPNLEIDPTKVQTISINSADKDVLGRHPYLNFKLATVILRYRQNHGPFQTMEDLKKIVAIDSETLKKIAPYLRFE